MRVTRAGGMRVTLPRNHFRAAFAKGELTKADLTEVLPEELTLADLDAALAQDAPVPVAFGTLWFASSMAVYETLRLVAGVPTTGEAAVSW